MSTTGTPERPTSQDALAPEEPVKRPAPGAGGAAVKRPRYEGKGFSELTITELENIVREATELKKQVATKDAEIAQLKEAVQSKAELAKQVKALEVELAAKQKEVDRAHSAVQEQKSDLAAESDRVKRVLKQQLKSQMFFHSGLKEQLQGSGREIVAFAANVGADVLKALGCEPGTKGRYADFFFEDGPPTKTVNGIKLVLARSVSFKYFKTSCELQMHAMYRIQGEGGRRPSQRKQAKKAPKKRTSKGGGARAAQGGEDGDHESEEEEEEAEADGAAEDEDEVEDKAEGEGQAEAEAEVSGAEAAAYQAAA